MSGSIKDHGVWYGGSEYSINSLGNVQADIATAQLQTVGNALILSPVRRRTNDKMSAAV